MKLTSELQGGSTMRHWTARLPHTACDDTLAWARTQPTRQAAWAACQRADWMLCVLARCAVSPARHRALIRIATDCVDRVRPLAGEAVVAGWTAWTAWVAWTIWATTRAATWAAEEAAWAAGATREARAAAWAAEQAAQAMIIRKHIPRPPRTAAWAPAPAAGVTECRRRAETDDHDLLESGKGTA